MGIHVSTAEIERSFLSEVYEINQLKIIKHFGKSILSAENHATTQMTALT